MFAKVLGLGAPVALGGLWMTGNLGGGAEGVVYDVPAAQVYQRLSTMPIPAELRKGTDGGVTVETEPEKTVRWKMTAQGYEALRITATITPMAGGKAAAVATEIEFAETGPQAADGKALNEMQSVKAIGGILIGEQIAATIEGRAFDQSEAKMKVAAYAIANRSQLMAEAAEIQARIKSSSFASASSDWYELPERDHVTEARVSRPTFDAGQPMVSNKPMVDLSR